MKIPKLDKKKKILLGIGLTGILAAIGYYVYQQYYATPSTATAMPGTASTPQITNKTQTPALPANFKSSTQTVTSTNGAALEQIDTTVQNELNPTIENDVNNGIYNMNIDNNLGWNPNPDYTLIPNQTFVPLSFNIDVLSQATQDQIINDVENNYPYGGGGTPSTFPNIVISQWQLVASPTPFTWIIWDPTTQQTYTSPYQGSPNTTNNS